MNPETKTTFNTFLTSSLNSEQQKAVQHNQGAMLVIAGAGSGKTRVITARIAHLILNEGVSANAIVALTFTNKAAKEMQERIHGFLGRSHMLPFIGTFHSYCVKLLKQNQELLDNPFFSILDSDDQQKLLNNIINRNGLQKEIVAKQLSYQISQMKNQAASPEQLEEMYKGNAILHSLYKAYEQEKRASKCLDFDDLLLEALKLFHNHAGFKNEHQAKVRHILVDEYQDTNVVQHELLKQMSKNSKNQFACDSICVVGDEDQSIYSWRGATIANIINFKKDFPDSQTIKIEQNYRSVQPILEIANHVIQNNQQRNPKKLWSDKKGHDRIRLISCLSEYQEGDAIAQLAQVASKSQKLNSIAVLYRTHFQSRAIEEALIRNSIPYKIIGGVQFYERKEIKDLLAYLRLIINPFDRASLLRVINVPTRGLGAKFEELFYETWHEQTFFNFHDVAQHLMKTMQVTGTKKVALEQFVAIFDGLSATTAPVKALESIITKSAYIGYLKDNFDTEDAQARVENAKELLNAVKHFETNNVTTIEQFLDEVALMQERSQKKDENQDALLLMTLHAAKGLEFDIVILTGLEDGLLPSSRSLSQLETLEEERRLFYVGITRARERLLLSHTKYRYAYRNMTDQQPSRFLEEIPKNLAPREDCSYWKTPEWRTYFSTWLGGRSTQPQPNTVMTFGSAQPLKKQNVVFDPKQPVARNPLAPFKKNQPVQHAKFGVGLVQEVEVKSDKTVYVTVGFKTGKKKVDAQFLKAT